MENAEISVIIPTRNRAAWLPTCLAHLEQQTFPAGRFEVLVVDDGSADDTVSVLERYASGSPVCIRCLDHGRRGMAEARNAGARAAAGTWLLFLRDDELVSPRLLEQHHAAQDGAGPAVCTMGDIRRHPQLPSGTFTRLILHSDDQPDRDGGETHFLDWPPSNFCLSRSAFLEAGGFSTEGQFRGVETHELAYRLCQAGINPVQLDDARAYVWQPATFHSERRRQYFFGYGMRQLQTRTGATSIPGRFRLKQGQTHKFARAFTIPLYVRACNRHEARATMLTGRLYRRVLRYDRFAGYDDADHGRPARPPAPEQPPEAGPVVLDEQAGRG